MSARTPEREVTMEIELALSWLYAAIKCGSFVWDPDQKLAAEDCLNEAQAEARRIRDEFKRLNALVLEYQADKYRQIHGVSA